MTLRLDGTGKDIGTATYNTTTGDIKAVKGGGQLDVRTSGGKRRRQLTAKTAALPVND